MEKKLPYQRVFIYSSLCYPSACYHINLIIFSLNNSLRFGRKSYNQVPESYLKAVGLQAIYFKMCVYVCICLKSVLIQLFLDRCSQHHSPNGANDPFCLHSFIEFKDWLVAKLILPAPEGFPFGQG